MNQEEALQKYGRIVVLEEVDGFGDLVFKKPARGDYMRYMSHLTEDDREKSATIIQFVKSCVVVPTVKEFDAVLDEYPGIVVDLASKLQDLASPDIKAIVKKGK